MGVIVALAIVEVVVVVVVVVTLNQFVLNWRQFNFSRVNQFLAPSFFS